MRTFINKISGVKWIALDHAVSEGADAWYIKYVNVSLPKAEWREEKETTKNKMQYGTRKVNGKVVCRDNSTIRQRTSNDKEAGGSDAPNGKNRALCRGSKRVL